MKPTGSSCEQELFRASSHRLLCIFHPPIMTKIAQAIFILTAPLLERCIAFVSSTGRLPYSLNHPPGSEIVGTNAVKSRTTIHHVDYHLVNARRPSLLMMAKDQGGSDGRSSSGVESPSEEETPAQVFGIDKLRAETKTPFRTLRLFIYGGFGFSALIGGLTALTQLAATLADQPGSLELKQVLINLAVDCAVVAAAAFGFNLETGQQAVLEKAEALTREKGRSLEATKITGDVNARRVERLRMLEVNVPGSEAQDGSGPRQASVGVLMDEASQAFCILAGSTSYLRDSIVSAMLVKTKIFPNTNLLLVPVDMTPEPAELSKGGGKGFGKTATYENEGYVAAPVHVESWRGLMSEELEAAERQGVTSGSGGKNGIVLVVSKEGKVLRRGVGIPAWEMVCEDLNPSKKKEGKN